MKVKVQVQVIKNNNEFDDRIAYGAAKFEAKVAPEVDSSVYLSGVPVYSTPEPVISSG